MKTGSVIKRIALLLMVAALAVAMVACEGPPGPRGPAGKDGTDGNDGTAGKDGTGRHVGQQPADGVCFAGASISPWVEPASLR